MSTFGYCTSLVEIIIPSSVKIIDEKAFIGCSSLLKVLFDDNSSLEIIQENAFDGCSKLTEISIPSSVISIESYAFNSCISLSKLIFSSNSKLKYIGNYAFKKCTSLLKISIPQSIKEIGTKVFEDCISLNEICLDLCSYKISSKIYKDLASSKLILSLYHRNQKKKKNICIFFQKIAIHFLKEMMNALIINILLTI